MANIKKASIPLLGIVILGFILPTVIAMTGAYATPNIGSGVYISDPICQAGGNINYAQILSPSIGGGLVDGIKRYSTWDDFQDYSTTGYVACYNFFSGSLNFWESFTFETISLTPNVGISRIKIYAMEYTTDVANFERGTDSTFKRDQWSLGNAHFELHLIATDVNNPMNTVDNLLGEADLSVDGFVGLTSFGFTSLGYVIQDIHPNYKVFELLEYETEMIQAQHIQWALVASCSGSGSGRTSINLAITEVEIIQNTAPVISNPSIVPSSPSVANDIDMSWHVVDEVHRSDWNYAIKVDGVSNPVVALPSGATDLYINYHIPAYSLAAGTHVIELRVFDMLGCYATKISTITISNINPSIAIEKTQFENGDDDKTLRWTLNDLSVNTALSRWELRDQNGYLLSQGNGWSTGTIISYNINSYPSRAYPYIFNLYVNDGYGGIVEEQYAIIVKNVHLSIISANAPNFEYGTIEYASAQFQDTLVGFGTYNVYVDGSLRANGNWANGRLEEVLLSGLGTGIHRIEFVASNNYLDTVSSGLIAFNVYNLAPIVENAISPIQILPNGFGSFDLEWNIEDTSMLNPTYQILVDDVLVQSQSLTSDIVTYTIYDDDFTVGNTYEVKIIVNDGLGESISSSYTISISDMIISASDLQFTYGETENYFEFTVDGIFETAGTYTIEIDGEYFSSGIWNDEIVNSINVDALSEGENHLVKIIAEDSSSNTVYNFYHVNVLDDDTDAPTVEITYSGDYTTANVGQVTFTATDPSGILGDSVKVFDVPTAAGTYYFEWTFTDADNDRVGDTSSNTVGYTLTIVEA